MSYSPSTEASYKEYHAMVATLAQLCVNQSTPKGIVAHVSGADTAQDWDIVRAALGYETMHVLSYS